MEALGKPKSLKATHLPPLLVSINFYFLIYLSFVYLVKYT